MRARVISRKESVSSLLLFSRNFLKHPRMLGSVIPSSRFLVNRLLRQVDWSRARTIVEYGPGVGTITSHLLRRLGPDGRLVAIDTNRDFVRHLGRTLRDPRLHVELDTLAASPRSPASRSGSAACLYCEP